MCVYKLVQADFAYWGMQSAVEGAVQRGQTSLFLHSHKQVRVHVMKKIQYFCSYLSVMLFAVFGLWRLRCFPGWMNGLK
jgi:hypothetical protein